MSPVEIWLRERTGLTGMTSAGLSSWQVNRLREVIEYAASRTRFYKGLDETVSLTRLPFTTPADIVSDPAAFLAIPPGDVARVTTLATSGTTGGRKRIFFSEEDLERIRVFFAVGMRTLVRSGQYTAILISDTTESSLGSLLKSALARLGVESEIPVIRDAAQAIDAARGADCLVGMPAELLYMSCLVPDLRPGSVLLTADYVPAAIIDRLRRTWNCRVYSHYGLTEVGFGFAVDCNSHEGHHYRAADFIVEIIDPLSGNPVDPGQSGEIVITSLSNEAMPLIRYRTGDRSRLIVAPCRCGGVAPRLGRIDGRLDKNGDPGDVWNVNIHRLDELLFADPDVRSFDAAWIRENEAIGLRLTFDASRSFDEKTLRERLPHDLPIRIRHADFDPFLERGKRTIRPDLSRPDRATTGSDSGCIPCSPQIERIEGGLRERSRRSGLPKSELLP